MLPDLALSLKSIARTTPVKNIFYGSKGVQAIEVLLYLYFASPFRKFIRTGLTYILTAVRQQKLPISMFPLGTELWAGCLGEKGVVRVGYVFI